MELEERIKALELEVKALKSDIQQTLHDIQQTLPEKPVPVNRWQHKAWVLALLNMLLAMALFSNLYLYFPNDSPFDLNPVLAAWLRAFWIALAFIWLMLQLYPLALLLEQEDQQWQGVVWRNAKAYLKAHPGTLVLITLGVLLISIVNSVFPAIWIVITLVMLIATGWLLVQAVLKLLRPQPHR
ncbi:MAG: hypothetical protein HY870_09125 [Chloroflexi bacterium]|nr:hypothetical protein [Chloroflexota bacterium]